MNKELLKSLEEISACNKEKCVSGISVDCIVFGFHEGILKVLLLRLMHSKSWALPGGYVRKDEDVDESAHRILKERTGAANIYLNQFKTFGRKNRSETYFEDSPNDLWHKQRFVSISYYALIDYETVQPKIDKFSDACEWKDIDDMPELMMDHQEIFDEAQFQLRKDLNYKPIGLNLLPEKFTLPELQNLYEVILGKKLNRGNFYRKMKRYDILEKLNETRRGGAHKAPELYKFDKTSYMQLLENGLQSVW